VSTLLVTVVGPADRRDLSLPADAPVAELIPTLVGLVADAGSPDRPGDWVLYRSDEPDDPLPPGSSLASTGVLEGTVLYLARSGAPEQEPGVGPAALPSDGLTPIERTAGVLPRRFGLVRRVGRAAAAFLGAGGSDGEARRSEPVVPAWAEPNTSPAALTAPERPSPAARVRRSWRATEYLEQLESAIEEPRLRRCATIAVISPKGGVGKTTITALLGTLLAMVRRDRVVAVDTNPDFGSLGRILTPDHHLFVDDLLDRVDDPGLTLTRLDAQLGRAIHGLMVLPAPTDPARMWRLDEDAYRRVIERLQDFAGILLLDCGTGLKEPAAGAAIRSSEQLILVTDAQPASASLVTEAGLLVAQTGRPIVLVVNKMPARGSVLDLEKFARGLPEASGLVVIPDEPGAAARLAAARFDWREAPASWQKAARELAVQVVSDWGPLGLTLRAPGLRPRA
jgi:MinD-like ATPase involved in chromosome partitioning or flagellar assembly